MSCGQCTLGYSVLWTVCTRAQCLVDSAVSGTVTRTGDALHCYTALFDGIVQYTRLIVQ